MTTTYCLGDFARELSRLPATREAWKPLIDARPEVCPRDCGQSCREVCRAYANVQFRCVTAKGRK